MRQVTTTDGVPDHHYTVTTEQHDEQGGILSYEGYRALPTGIAQFYAWRSQRGSTGVAGIRYVHGGRLWHQSYNYWLPYAELARKVVEFVAWLQAERPVPAGSVDK